jgi:hypothetical protein
VIKFIFLCLIIFIIDENSFLLFKKNTQHCVTGCGEVESAQHLFLSCGTFGSLWPMVRSWIGFSSVDAHTLLDHFVQFTYLAGGLCARRSFLQLIWLACGLCGVREIIVCSEAQQIPYNNFWTR